MGRALAPTPHLSAVVLCGMLIAEVGREEQRLGYLPGIGAGDLIGALALTESSGGVREIAATASIEGEAIVLNGRQALRPRWGRRRLLHRRGAGRRFGGRGRNLAVHRPRR